VSAPFQKHDLALWPLVEQSFCGVLLVDPRIWRIQYVNPTAADWFGRLADELSGVRIGDLFNDASMDSVLARLNQCWSGKDSDEPLLAGLRSSGGDPKIVSVRTCRIEDGRETLIGVLLGSVVTTQFDPVTSLRDRNHLYSRLFELLGQADAKRFAVLFVDVNDFKHVNDRYGHLVGDHVLFEVAKRVSLSVGHKHDVTRYGGDEFVVVVDDFESAGQLEELVERICTAIEPPIHVPNGEVTLTASIGIAISSAEYRTPNDVLGAADRAMYAAKRGS
jgi:diguanylate cyclase (GGDEF)-like protein